MFGSKKKKKVRTGNKSKLGRNIRKYRIRNRETQQELGDYLGYGATTVANYESGYRTPDIQTLMMIADHYGVSVEDLIR